MKPSDETLQESGVDVDALVSSFLGELAALASEPQAPSAGGNESASLLARGDLEAILTGEGGRGELKFEDAAKLWSAIAGRDSRVDTPEGEARVRTVLYLAGGNRSAYGVFASLLARARSAAQVEALLGALDGRFAGTGEVLAVSEQEDAVVWLLRGWALGETGRYAEALSFCDRSIQLDPDRADAWWCRGTILLGLSRPDEALHSCQQAVELDAGAPSAWVGCGMALDGLGRRREALEALDHAFALGEDSSRVHFKRAEVLIGLDRWREGMTLLDEALGRFAHADPPDSGNTRAIILKLLPGLGAPPQILRLSVRALTLIYRKHRALVPLGQGLIDCIPDVVAPDALGGVDASLWCDAWRAAAGRLPQFLRPLRLLDHAVRYQRDRDPLILSGLPAEERIALDRLIGQSRVELSPCAAVN